VEVEDPEQQESEAVKARYEEINRLLGSLALSRRRIQVADEAEEDEDADPDA